ncbi:MAG TPA: flavin reductase [Oscillospiraceae bacterium]|nr:flavin reductase [Oscillospiraceae bacterium]
MDNKAMYKIGYGLYVLTVKDGEFDNGCITNTVMQVTTTPNRIVVTVNKRNYTHDIMLKKDEFNVSIIDVTAPFDLFKQFGFKSGRDTDKFADFDAKERSENGIYYITEYCNSYISAKIISRTDLGTHTMFVADVTDAKVLSDYDSATYAYYHSNIKQKPDSTVTKGWRCKICGYIYEGEDLPPDFICPVCKHPASDFEKIE